MQRSVHTYLTVHNPLVTLINAIAAVLVVFAKRTPFLYLSVYNYPGYCLLLEYIGYVVDLFTCT